MQRKSDDDSRPVGSFGQKATRPYLALENHLNYVYHAERELTVDEVSG